MPLATDKVAHNKLLGATFEVFGATTVAPDDYFCPSDPRICCKKVGIYLKN